MSNQRRANSAQRLKKEKELHKQIGYKIKSLKKKKIHSILHLTNVSWQLSAQRRLLFE